MTTALTEPRHPWTDDDTGGSITFIGEDPARRYQPQRGVARRLGEYVISCRLLRSPRGQRRTIARGLKFRAG
jgi:hypothetical protein